MGDDVRKRPWSSAGKGRVESSEKELGTTTRGFLWTLNVVGHLHPLELNKPESKGTNFCNIEPTLRGIKTSVHCTLPLKHPLFGKIEVLLHTCAPITTFLLQALHQGVAWGHFAGGRPHSLCSLWGLWDGPCWLPRWMFMGPGGPCPCLKSPDALFSIVLVVETKTLLLTSPDTDVLP